MYNMLLYHMCWEKNVFTLFRWLSWSGFSDSLLYFPYCDSRAINLAPLRCEIHQYVRGNPFRRVTSHNSTLTKQLHPLGLFDTCALMIFIIFFHLRRFWRIFFLCLSCLFVKLFDTFLRSRSYGYRTLDIN